MCLHFWVMSLVEVEKGSVRAMLRTPSVQTQNLAYCWILTYFSANASLSDLWPRLPVSFSCSTSFALPAFVRMCNQGTMKLKLLNKDEFGRIRKRGGIDSLFFFPFIYLFVMKCLLGKFVSLILALSPTFHLGFSSPCFPRFFLFVCFLIVPVIESLAWLILGPNFRSKQLPDRSFRLSFRISELRTLLKLSSRSTIKFSAVF